MLMQLTCCSCKFAAPDTPALAHPAPARQCARQCAPLPCRFKVTGVAVLKRGSVEAPFGNRPNCSPVTSPQHVPLHACALMDFCHPPPPSPSPRKITVVSTPPSICPEPFVAFCSQDTRLSFISFLRHFQNMKTLKNRAQHLLSKRALT